MITEHIHGVECHQRIQGPPRIERPTRHVAEIDDLVDAMRADIGYDSLKREIISVHIGNRGKTHRKRGSILAACR